MSFLGCFVYRSWNTKAKQRILVSLFLQVSALLGRIPSAVGYQPTLATDMGTMQERITTTRKGSITSVQVNYNNSEAISKTFFYLNDHFYLGKRLKVLQ